MVKKMSAYCLRITDRFPRLRRALGMMTVEETIYIDAGSLEEAKRTYKQRHP